MAKKPSSIPRLRIGLNVLVQATLALVLFGIANYLGFNHFKRWDYSRDQKYALGVQTKRVIANLKKPVRFIVFFSGASPVAQDTINLLKEYTYVSKKMIDMEIVDPFLAMTRAREIATQYKLRDNDNVVIVDTDGRNKFVNATAMAEFEPSLNLLDKPRLKTFKGEAAITSALIELTEPGTNRVYSLSGHGETGLTSDSKLSGLKAYIERQNVQVEPLNLAGVETLPADAKAIFIIAPKYDLTEAEFQALHTYWTEKHGRLFVALEPGANTPRLASLLAELGVMANDDRVLKTVPVRLASGIARGILKEITGDFVAGSPITRRLTNVSAQFVGGPSQSLTLSEEQAKAAGIKLQKLIQAASGFWGETRYANSATEGVYFDPKEDHINPVIAASAEKGALIDPRLRVESSSRLVAVGSSGFLSNDTLNEASLDFVLNSLNWLLDREEIMGIAPKPVRNLALNLTEAQLGSIAALVMAAIPACCAALGFIVWLKRRR